MDIPLSILDFTHIESGSNSIQTLQNTLKQARLADRLGYTRYWVSEHHNVDTLASASPEILIGHIAQVTERIRVGAGGMMLPNHSPLKLAELFRLLEALHPGRIDLGIGRSSGAVDIATALALRTLKAAPNTDIMPELLADLFTFVGEGNALSLHPQMQSVRAMPTDVKLPPIWMLGSSERGARAAAEQGLGFAFARHINPEHAISATRLYRELFKPSVRVQKPQVILTCSVICAETDEQVEELVTAACLLQILSSNNHARHLLSPQEVQTHQYTSEEREAMEKIRARVIAGRPAIVREKLLDLVQQTGADELMLFTVMYGYENRALMLEILADVFHLQQ